MAERVTFTTVDEVTIVGDWVTAPTMIGAVILLHSMPQNRLSWSAFQSLLATRNLASLAIDLRGHGESLQGPGGAGIDFKNFSDTEHQSALYDVIAAYEWVLRRGIDPVRIALGGASIGANLAVQMLVEETRLRGAVLLSPGKNYHGLDATQDIEAILPHQSVWIAASEGDDQEAFESAKKMSEVTPSDRKTFVPLKNAGHGLAMFTAQPPLAEQAADFLKDSIQ
jgi:pimeloyl-ACP methyl ester carboxylesterase